MRKQLCSLFALTTLFSCSDSHDPSIVKASGIIEPYYRVNVGSRVADQVKEMYVDEGDEVKKGQQIAQIDATLLHLQLDQQNANVQLAQANLDLIVKGSRKEDIQSAQDRLEEAKSSLHIATLNRDRIVNLFEKNSATESQRDEAVSNYNIELAQKSSAEQELEKTTHLARPEEIREAEAQLAIAKAEADYTQQRINDSTVLAPLDGIIAYKPIDAGELVNEGTTLVTISHLNKVKLTVYVPETDLGKVKVNQEATVTVDSYPERSFKGSVVFISPQAEYTPKNVQTHEQRVKLVYQVKIAIENPEGIFKGGLPADASIHVGNNP